EAIHAPAPMTMSRPSLGTASWRSSPVKRMSCVPVSSATPWPKNAYSSTVMFPETVLSSASLSTAVDATCSRSPGPQSRGVVSSASRSAASSRRMRSLAMASTHVYSQCPMRLRTGPNSRERLGSGVIVELARLTKGWPAGHWVTKARTPATLTQPAQRPVMDRVGVGERLVTALELVPQVGVEQARREDGDVRLLLDDQAEEVRSVRVGRVSAGPDAFVVLQRGECVDPAQQGGQGPQALDVGIDIHAPVAMQHLIAHEVRQLRVRARSLAFCRADAERRQVGVGPQPHLPVRG